MPDRFTSVSTTCNLSVDNSSASVDVRLFVYKGRKTIVPTVSLVVRINPIVAHV